MYLEAGLGIVHVCYTAVNELHSNKLVMLCFSVTALTQEPRNSAATEIKRLTGILSADQQLMVSQSGDDNESPTHFVRPEN